MKESSFQFSNPRIIFLNFEINEQFIKDSYEGFALSNEIHKYIIKEDKEAIVTLLLIIGDDNEKSPFSIKLEMSAKFSCDDPNLFNRLIDTNAPAMLLSYARPIVSLITSQSGFPPFDIPFINFVND